MKNSVATEAIMFSRGGQLNILEKFDREKLIDWLIARLPALIKFSKPVE